MPEDVLAVSERYLEVMKSLSILLQTNKVANGPLSAKDLETYRRIDARVMRVRALPMLLCFRKEVSREMRMCVSVLTSVLARQVSQAHFCALHRLQSLRRIPRTVRWVQAVPDNF